MNEETSANVLRLELRSRNNALWHAIYDKWPSVAAFCREKELSQQDVGRYLNLKDSPYSRKDRSKLRPLPQKLCDIFGLTSYQLFQPELYDEDLIPRETQVAEVDPAMFVPLQAAAEVPQLTTSIEEVMDLGPDPLEGVEQTLQTLTPREETILKMRFGIDEDIATYDELGDAFNVTRERIRQIEGKALRKLRHPLRSRRLKEIITGKAHDPKRRKLTPTPQQREKREREATSKVRQWMERRDFKKWKDRMATTKGGT